MTNAELRRLAESCRALEVKWWEEEDIQCGMRDGMESQDSEFIAAASPDVIIALLDRCERAEAIAAAHETQPEYRRMVSWTDDVTGDVYGQTADDLTLAEAHAFTARNEVAIAIRNFFRDLRIDTLRARCEALEKERDAMLSSIRYFDEACNYAAEMSGHGERYEAAKSYRDDAEKALRAHAAKGGE